MTQPGDVAFLGSMIGGLDFFGVMGDGQAPPMINGSFELSGTDGGQDLTSIQGPQGPPGTVADIVKLQFEDNFTSPSQLPENLENIALDIGKAFWIGNVLYVWTGVTFFQKTIGVPGPPGPTPVISAQAELVPSGQPTSLTQPIEVQQFDAGSATPTLLFEFDQDSITGPPGPTGPIVDAADYDNATPPQNGDAIVWNSELQMFQPGGFDLLTMPMFSVPEGAFQSVTVLTPLEGDANGQVVLSFAVPQQPFNWVPLCLGNIAASLVGIFDLFVNPANIGAAVYLGAPSIAEGGQLVARGFGNVTNYAFILPHFSTPSSPNTSISPTSTTAVVPAFHTGNQGTIYVVLTNDGIIIPFQFQSANSQLLIACVAVSDFIPPSIAGHQLSGQGSLTCTTQVVEGS
jgi:hypothetical protein